MEWTAEELQAIVDEHDLVLFMKGTPDKPGCGFSAHVVQILNKLNVLNIFLQIP